MRRMLSDKNVVDVVNEAIDEGEISVGGLPEIESGDAGKALIVNSGETGVEWGEVGLSPEDQEKLDNSLQLPESAPAAQQLVGINTSGTQNALEIGSGLEISNGALTSDLKYIILDFGSQTGGTWSITVSETIANNITDQAYDFIIARHKETVSSVLVDRNFVLPRGISNLEPYSYSFNHAEVNSPTYLKFLNTITFSNYKLGVSGTTITLQKFSDTNTLTEAGINSNLSYEIVNGTVSNRGKVLTPNNNLFNTATYYIKDGSSNRIFMYPVHFDNANRILYLRSQASSFSSVIYEAQLNTSTGACSYSTVQ